ncbi:MAG: hypothetical protein HC784_14120 [Hydrococcus sp. CSU_1_8]|nr:hypothetical protein [Hydrococcus sp. CSU_1_8]
MKTKLPVRKISISIATICLLSASTIPARASILSIIAGAFGYGDLYTSVDGLYNSASDLYATIQEVSAGVSNSTTQGLLGIADPNKLKAAAISLLRSEGITTDIGLNSTRMNGRVGAQIASAPNSIEGQKNAEKMLQQQANLAAAASTAADNVLGATSTLEAIQQIQLSTTLYHNNYLQLPPY